MKYDIREFLKYVSFSILGMLGLSFYILIDTYFVANRLGTEGIAALNLALPVYNFLHGCGLMTGIGGAAKYSIYKGQKNENAKITFTNSVYFALILAIIFVLTGVFFSEKISVLLGADKVLFPMTNIYMKVILIFSPAFLFNNVLINYVRNDGSPKLCTVAMISGSLMNVLLDYVFMYPMKLGMFGAVLATGFSPLTSISILSLHFIKKKNNFVFVKTKPQIKLMLSQASLGLSSLVSEVSSGVAIIVFNFIFLKFLGNTGVAAYAIVANWALVLVAMCNGLAQGAQPLFSKTYGSGDMHKLKKYLKYAFIFLAAMFVVIYLGVLFATTPLTAIFNAENDAKLQKIGELGMRLYFAAAPFIGGNILFSIYFASTDKAFPSHIIALLRGIVIIIPVAFMMAAFGGITGVWLTFLITESIVFVIAVIFYRYYNKKTGKESRALSMQRNK